MKNRIVLITGGASGIGKAMVRMFADRGCQVIIFDVQDDKGEVLAKELCDQRKKVVYKHVNLFDIDEIKSAYIWIEEIKIMKENGFGRIVNTASGAGLLGVKGNSIYCAAKHGVVGITKAAALDYATSNITINAIAPGTIETELVNSLKEIAPEAYKQAEESNPAGHLGKPEDIANAALFLCEDTSSFINGVILPVDSGCVAGK